MCVHPLRRKKADRVVSSACRILPDSVDELDINSIVFKHRRQSTLSVATRVRLVRVRLRHEPHVVQTFVHAADLGSIVERKSNISRLFGAFRSPHEKLLMCVPGTHNHAVGQVANVLTHAGVVAFMKHRRVEDQHALRLWIGLEILPLLSSTPPQVSFGNPRPRKQQQQSLLQSKRNARGKKKKKLLLLPPLLESLRRCPGNELLQQQSPSPSSPPPLSLCDAPWSFASNQSEVGSECRSTDADSDGDSDSDCDSVAFSTLYPFSTITSLFGRHNQEQQKQEGIFEGGDAVFEEGDAVPSILDTWDVSSSNLVEVKDGMTDEREHEHEYLHSADLLHEFKLPIKGDSDDNDPARSRFWFDATHQCLHVLPELTYPTLSDPLMMSVLDANSDAQAAEAQAAAEAAAAATVDWNGSSLSRVDLPVALSASSRDDILLSTTVRRAWQEEEEEDMDNNPVYYSSPSSPLPPWPSSSSSPVDSLMSDDPTFDEPDFYEIYLQHCAEFHRLSQAILRQHDPFRAVSQPIFV